MAIAQNHAVSGETECDGNMFEEVTPFDPSPLMIRAGAISLAVSKDGYLRLSEFGRNAFDEKARKVFLAMMKADPGFVERLAQSVASAG
jgi:hypothetical protein